MCLCSVYRYPILSSESQVERTQIRRQLAEFHYQDDYDIQDMAII